MKCPAVLKKQSTTFLHQCLDWTVKGQFCELQMSPVKIDGAKRQLFSLAKSQNIKLQEAALKRRKSPSPASDLADAPAADAAADDDTAEPTGEEEEPQGVSSGRQKKKTAKLKKQRSGGEEAVDAVGKAGPMKRKRKGDAEAKVCFST